MAVMRDQVTVTASGAVAASLTGAARRIRVENVDGAGSITFTVDGTTAVVGTAEQFVVAKAAGANREVSVPSGPDVTLSLIASVDTEAYVAVVELDDDE